MAPGQPSEGRKLQDMRKILLSLVRLPAVQDSESFLVEVGKRLVLRHVAPGVPVVVVGEKAKAMFFVIRGKLKVTSEDGEAIFAELGPGSMFGEIGAILGVSRTASVVSITSCILGVLCSRDLNKLLATHGSVKEYLLREVERRLHGLKLDYETLLSTANKDETSDSLESPAVEHSPTNEHPETAGGLGAGSASAQSSEASVNVRRASAQLTDIELSIVTQNSAGNTLGDSFSPISPLYSTSPRSEKGYIDALVPCPKIVTRQTGSGGLDFQLKPLPQGMEMDPISPVSVRRRSKVAESAILQTHDEQQKQQSPAPSARLPELEEPRRASIFIRPDQLPPHLALQAQQNAEAESEESSKHLKDAAADSESAPPAPQPSAQPDTTHIIPDENSLPIINSLLSINFPPVKDSEDLSDDSAGSMKYGKLGMRPMILALKFLPVPTRFKTREISKAIYALLVDPDKHLFSTVDLSPVSKRATDRILLSILALGRNNVRELNLGNCCFITGTGLMLATKLSPDIRVLSLSNMWNTTDATIINIVDNLQNIVELDLSNIRTVSYTTILHIVKTLKNLKTLIMSYCKNVTAAALETPHWAQLSRINFQRCTSISSLGFHSWYTMTTGYSVESLLSPNEADWLPDKLLYNWELKELVLSDCTFLEDLALMSVVSICPLLERLSLSFCCSLTETCVVHMSKVCKNLQFLDLSFCGDAVTDFSLSQIASISTLRGLYIRGCVQVTPEGILNVASTSKNLKYMSFKNCLDSEVERSVIEHMKRDAPHISLVTQGRSPDEAI